PARNQVLITGPISSLPWQGTFHVDKGYIYFRNVGNRLLLGGARNIDPEGETTAEFGHSESIQTYLTDFLQQKLLPNSQVSIENWWSGIMGVGPTKRAIVKQISDRISLAVRLGGMGVALGSKIAEEAAILLRPQ
nr:FAD-binding oxidoreductase [Saprospiraceae bacterium]